MSRSNIEKNLASLEQRDKDERYMGTSDLCNELQKDVKLDTAMEARVCSAILKRLDDTSNDVQSKAIQCLGILLGKVQRAQVFEISDKLCTLILEGKDELRDIYSIGLKTLIMDVPDDSGRGLAVRLVKRLLDGIKQTSNSDVTLECLDCLTDVLRRFGFEVVSDHETIVSTLLEQLSSPKKAAQKKAITCLSAAALVLSDTLLNKLVDSLMTATSSSTDIRVVVTAIGQVSRSVGHRMGRHLPTVVPLFLKFLGNPDDESLQSEAHAELRETSLQGFESLVQRCPREIPSHLVAITQSASAFMKYDPNYCGDDDDDDEDGGSDEDFDDYDDEGDDEDDDTSWKIRRAAVKVLSVIATRPDQIALFYKERGTEIVNRMKEREENVRLDVIECVANSVRTAQLSQDPEAIAALSALLPSIVTICGKHLAAKEDKTKTAVFGLLCILVELVPDGIASFASKLFPLVSSNLSLKTASHSLKLDALYFLQGCLKQCKPQDLRNEMNLLLPVVLSVVGEDWYKLIAQALRVVSASIDVFRPCTDGMFDSENSSDAATLQKQASDMFTAILPRLEANDIDQEIKECAISATGNLISRLGDQFDISAMLSLLSEKLRNDVTRMPTLKALTMIAQSPLSISLDTILPGTMTVLSEFLRQASRPLKQSTFETLLALVDAYGAQMDINLLNNVLKETSPLISDADLHLTHLGLKLTCQVLGANASTAPTAATTILPAALHLASSPLLQGRALQSLLELFKSLVRINAPGYGFEDLYRELRARVDDSAVQKQGIANVSHGLCALICEAGAGGETATASLVSQLDPAQGDGTARLVALLTLGEMGQYKDLSSIPNLQNLILSGFDSISEETKTASAFALGSTAVGSMSLFLPSILSSLQQDRNHYLLLSSLKEVIVLHASNKQDFSSYLNQVLPPLKEHCRSPEEGVRNMVAECLGALVTMHAEMMVAELMALMANVEDVLVRWTVASSLKYAMNGSSQEVLSAHMAHFLSLMSDEDLGVKQSALHMCNAMVHHQPALAAPFIANTILPILCSTLTFKSERVVDLGPFKQKVDDGLPLRKASLTTIATILDIMPERFDVGLFMEPLAGALGDSEADMQILAHHVTIKLCKLDVLKSAMLCCVDVIVDPLKALIDKTQKSLAKKAKEESAGGTEVERLYDLLRSAVRTVVTLDAAIRNTDDSSTSPKFKALLEVVLQNEKLRAMAEAIKQEN